MTPFLLSFDLGFSLSLLSFLSLLSQQKSFHCRLVATKIYKTICPCLDGRKERKETVPTRTFLQWFVEHMGNGDNKVRSPQGIMEAFVYECMADDQEKLTNDGFADDFFVHLMEYKYIRRYFSPIIPRIREIINLTACNLCDSPGTSQTSVNQISLHYLTE